MLIETSKSQKEFRSSKGLGNPTADCEGCNKPVSVAVSLYDARKQWAEAGYELSNRTERRRRYSICKQCDSLVNGKCKECRCFMRIKSLLAGMTCKLDKW